MRTGYRTTNSTSVPTSISTTGSSISGRSVSIDRFPMGRDQGISLSGRGSRVHISSFMGIFPTVHHRAGGGMSASSMAVRTVINGAPISLGTRWSPISITRLVRGISRVNYVSYLRPYSGSVVGVRRGTRIRPSTPTARSGEGVIFGAFPAHRGHGGNASGSIHLPISSHDGEGKVGGGSRLSIEVSIAFRPLGGVCISGISGDVSPTISPVIHGWVGHVNGTNGDHPWYGIIAVSGVSGISLRAPL